MDTVPSNEVDDANALMQTLLTAIRDLATQAPTMLNPERQRHGPKRTDPVHGPALQRRRVLLQLAIAGTSLARGALDDDPDIEQLAEELLVAHRQFVACKRQVNGWLDTRMVMRPQIQRDMDVKTGEVSSVVVRVPNGPYAYYRWIEDGKRRSLYLGRADNQEGWREKLAEIGVDLNALLTRRDVADMRDDQAIVLAEISADLHRRSTSPDAALDMQTTPPATTAEAVLPLATVPVELEPFRMDGPLPRIPLSYGTVKQQKKELTTFVATLRHKANLGKHDGQQLLGMMQAMLTRYEAENRRRATLEELDRPHADADALAVAITDVHRLAAQNPRARAWQQVIDEGTTRLATGPIRREADRYALFNTAEELATETALAAISGDDLLPYLEAQDIDPTPYL